MQFLYLLIFIIKLLLATKGIDISDIHLLYPEWDLCESNLKLSLEGDSDVPADKSPKYHVLEKKAQNTNGSWNIPDSASQNNNGAWSNNSSDTYTGSDNHSDSDSDKDDYLFNSSPRANPNPNPNADNRTLGDVLTRDQIMELHDKIVRTNQIHHNVELIERRHMALEDHILTMERESEVPELLSENARYIALKNAYARTHMEIMSEVRTIRVIEADIQRVWPAYVSPFSKYPFERINAAPQGFDG